MLIDRTLDHALLIWRLLFRLASVFDGFRVGARLRDWAWGKKLDRLVKVRGPQNDHGWYRMGEL